MSYTYTPSGKTDTITLPDSTTSFTYDQKDNLTQMQDRLGTTTYTWDAAQRLTSKTDANGVSVSFTYDDNGNLASLTYPGNKTVTYAYDALNRLHTVTDWLDRTATSVYDAAGRLTSLTQFNGTVVQYTFDNANRLTGLENLTASSGSAIATYQFTLDNNGNRTDAIQEVPISPDLAALATTFTTSAAGNRLIQAGSNTFTYDDQGQLITAYGNTLTFDPEHRLTSIGTTSEFKYDGTGARLEAIRNSVTTRYIYDAAGNLLAEANAANQIQRYYIYGAGLLAMAETDNTLYCYHFDATGHTVALTDINKTIVNKYAYSPFGTLANQEETVAQPFKFVGQYGVMTEDNGWYYMRARYYDPAVGRFISEDPLGFDGGDVNLYAYVLNNPVMFSDPLGLRVSQIYRPLGNGAWPAGYHTALNVNGRIYGFGPHGVTEENPASYGWGSHEVVIYSGNGHDQAFLGYLQNAATGNDTRFTEDTYRVTQNNCMSFIDTAVIEAPNWQAPNSTSYNSTSVNTSYNSSFGATYK